MTAFALYRLPHQQEVTLVEQTTGNPTEITSLQELNGRQGFVVAPFQTSAECPVLLIRPDRVQTFRNYALGIVPLLSESGAAFLPVKCHSTARKAPLPSCERADYASDFARFHQQLREGRFRKIVLSRCAEQLFDDDADPLQLFGRACEFYPRLFISLVYTPQSGYWLTATPEVLLEGQNGRWHTMALAGTMTLEGDDLNGEGERVQWSDKNIQEQRYVASYIMDCLTHLATDIREEGPRTVRAANLVHLRSDFTFNLLDDACVGNLISQLHPTPAVCGLPKAETYRFIQEHEHTPRRYYSGFMGPLHLQSATHLYVTLRCMQIAEGKYRLYAGGGLLKDSVEEQEWQETEAKLETMRQCIATKKM